MIIQTQLEQNLKEYLLKNKPHNLKALKLELKPLTNIANTHTCPKNGKINFLRNPKLPLHYPGLYGRVWFRTDGTDINTFSKSVCKIIKTGTGGAGVYEGVWSAISKAKQIVHHKRSINSYSYHCNIYGDDFPDILGIIAYNEMSKGEKVTNIYIDWIDKQLALEDQRIIQLAKTQQRNYYATETKV